MDIIAGQLNQLQAYFVGKPKMVGQKPKTAELLLKP